MYLSYQAAAYFANFDVPSSTTNHSCTLVKQAQKYKNGSNLAQSEVAPSCQKQGILLIKVKFQTYQNWLKLQFLPNFASKMMQKRKFEQLLTSNLEIYKIAQFLATLLADLYSKTLTDRRNFIFRDIFILKPVIGLLDQTTLVVNCGN